MKTKKFKLGIFLGMLFMLLVGTVQAFAVDAIPMEWGKPYDVYPASIKDSTRYFTFKLDSPAKVRISGTILEETSADWGCLEIRLNPENDSIFAGTSVVEYSYGMTIKPYTEMVLNKGTHTLRVVQSRTRHYSICVGLRESYKEGPATAITLPKSVTVSKGIKYQLKPTLVNFYEKLTGMKWSISGKNGKKIAAVDANGVITPKKKGSCTVVCTLNNGKTYSCKVTVKDNVWTGRSYSKIHVNNYNYGQVWLEPTKISYSGSKLKVECAALNNRMFKAKYFSWIEMTVYDGNRNVIAKTKFGRKNLNLKKYGKKKMTFTFPAKAVKKKGYDLRSDNGIYIDYDYYYYYQIR